MALFKIYKRGQGYYTRLWSGLVTFSIAASGCYVLWRKMEVITNLWVKTLVPMGLCVGFGFLVFWLMNKPAAADFMIAAEGEIKKVSWSSRREITASTLIVIFVVVLMAIMLFVADMVLSYLFKEVVGI
jgi:preprotein translocase subunit SecE